jgi:hypothetical protein
MATLQEKVALLKEVEETKTELNSVTKALEEQAKGLREEIKGYLELNKQSSAKFEGLGTVYLESKETVYLEDAESACRYMYTCMNQAIKKGEPLVNSMVWQKRALQGELLSLAREHLAQTKLVDNYDNLNGYLNQIGFRYITETILKHRKG